MSRCLCTYIISDSITVYRRPSRREKGEKQGKYSLGLLQGWLLLREQYYKSQTPLDAAGHFCRPLISPHIITNGTKNRETL